MRQSLRQGVSLLLEVVFGLGLFAISVLLLFGIFPNSHRATTQAKNTSLATNLARELLESDISRGYDNVPLGTTNNVVPVASIVNGTPVTVNFNTTVAVTAHAQPEIRVVTVTVAWSEGPINRQVRLVGYVGDF